MAAVQCEHSAQQTVPDSPDSSEGDSSTAECAMTKEYIEQADGRYVILYSFDSYNEVGSEQSEERGTP
jgi:hypothetical protein